MTSHPRTAFSTLPSAQASYSEIYAARCFNSSHVSCPFVDTEGQEPESQMEIVLNGGSPKFGRNCLYSVSRVGNILHLLFFF